MMAISCVVGCYRTTDDQRISQAFEAIQRRDYSTATGQLDQLLHDHPDHTLGLLYRAQISHETQQNDDALNFLSRIPHRESKDSATARFMEGVIHIGRHDPGLAESCFRDATQQNPENVRAYERLLQLYALQRRRVETLDTLAKIKRLRPLSLPELNLQLTAGERLLEPALAIPLLERQVKTSFNYRASRVVLAQYLLSDGQTARGLTLLEQACRDFPSDTRIRGMYAEALLDQDRREEAAEILGTAALQEESSPELWFSYGRLCETGHDWSTTAQIYQGVLQRDRWHRGAWYRLGLLLQKNMGGDAGQANIDRAGKLNDLREHVEEIGIRIIRKQLHANLIQRVGDLLVELGEFRIAEDWYRHGLRLPDATSDIASALAKLEKVDQESEVYSETINLPNVKLPFKLPPSLGARQASVLHETSSSIIKFRNDAHATGLGFKYFNGESTFKYLIESMGGGVGVIDFDLDGWPDIFFPQGAPLPATSATHHYSDELYRNFGENQFHSVSVPCGLSDLGYSLGVAVGDLDNDGFPDILVSRYGTSSLYQNQGDGTFVDMSTRAGLNLPAMSTSCAFADLDCDGNLDIYLVNYVDGLRVCHDDQGHIASCNPRMHQGQDDIVYRSLGDGRFVDVTNSAGLLKKGKGLGVVIADFDDDGKVDIFVANDTTPNFLYLNVSISGRIQLSEQGLISGVALSPDGNAQAGMGIACGDIDGNLLLDLYVTYFRREANGLYLNEGQGLFRDATRTAGLYEPTLPFLGFGTQTVDFDGNGWPELFVANGHIDDLRHNGEPWKMRPQLFVSKAGRIFHERSDLAGDYFQEAYLGRGVAHCDWNRDGKPDLVVVHQDRPAALLTNVTEKSGNVLRIELSGRRCQRDAIGARIKVTSGGRIQRMDITSGDGYLCSNQRVLQFGLGDLTSATEVEVRWPDGSFQTWNNLPTGIQWLLIQDSAAPHSRDLLSTSWEMSLADE